MTTTENYIYRFDAALDSKPWTNSPHDLVRSLGITVSEANPNWNALIERIKKNQTLGLDYGEARASLALLCQDILAPIQSPINYLYAAIEHDDPNVTTSYSSNKGKVVYCLGGSVSGRAFHSYRPVPSNPINDFPEAFGDILREYGLAKELVDVQVRRRRCQEISVESCITCRVSLEFFDSKRSLSWWCAGIGPGHLTSTSQAAFDGYRFALDPRRSEIPEKSFAPSGKAFG